MGCDIHVYTEQYDERNGVWYTNDNFRLNRYYDGDPDNGNQFEHESVYHGRNYQLFGILANVRDYNETALVSPRGIPEDSCDFIKKTCEYWGSDGHSHSYMSLRELKDALIYKRPNTRSGVKSLERFVKCIEDKLRKDFNYFNWDDENDGMLQKLIDNHRVVFWFDN